MSLKKKLDSIKPHFSPGGRWSALGSVFDGFYTFLYTPAETAGERGAHIRDANDSKRTMTTVIVALLPCLIFGMWNVGYQHYLALHQSLGFWGCFLYGLWAVLPQIIVSYAVGLGIEFISAQLRGHEIQEGYLVTGLLIPMICPVDTPLWMLAVAVAFSVIFAKEVFGGTGYNIFNPALVARAFLFFAYPSKMSGDSVFVSALPDGATGATPLGQIASSGATQITDLAGNHLSLWDCFLGVAPGSWGETSTLCILIGAAILLWSGMGSWRIMLSATLGAWLMALLAHACATPAYPVTMLPAQWQMCLGGLAFAIVFMATDPVTACRTNAGKLIYGFLIGVLAIVIRCYNAGYPEGAMLAVLLMNSFSSLIDWCVVRINVRRRLARIKVEA